jgi:hypothetical protein
MRANLYIDRGHNPLVSCAAELLTDGSEAWNIYLRGGEIIPCASEKLADEAFSLIEQGLRKTMAEVRVF